MRRRGFTLLEVVVTTAISVLVLATGYTLYIGVMRTQEMESQRESMMLTVQSAMAQIKKDIRTANNVCANQNMLVIDNGQVLYKNLPNGVGMERITVEHAKRTYRGLSAIFKSGSNRGVGVKLQSRKRVGRRLIHVEVSTVVFSRNG